MKFVPHDSTLFQLFLETSIFRSSLIVVFLFIYSTVVLSTKSRIVTVKGPKGTITREFKHMQLDMQVADDKKSLKVDLWFGNRENIAAVR